MRRRRSLRIRVALAFAGLGALLSLMLALGIYYAAHDVSQRLMDETLDAELADYMARHARNPQSLPPATASLNGYLIQTGKDAAELPPALADLPPGKHEVSSDNIPYRIAIADRDGFRYVLLFDESRQALREQRFLGYLIAAALLMTLLATGGGLWLAGRVIAPVTELATAVGGADPDNPPRFAHLAKAGDPGDEIDGLARAFDRYNERLAAFIERERAFAADASHELRTPLAVIRGAAEVLAEDPALGPAQIERIARIERAALDMTELIAALLLLANEKSTPVETPCDALRIAADCIERYRSLAVAQNTRITTDFATTVQLTVPPALFSIALANLLHNALAHTRNGQIVIHLDTQGLVVSDTGSGIPEGDIERVFDRHFRGSDSAGAGIGLSLVKRVCDHLGWSIALSSGPNKGTLATLSFRA
jgi:signal transduction histidine kinase